MATETGTGRYPKFRAPSALLAGHISGLLYNLLKGWTSGPAEMDAIRRDRCLDAGMAMAAALQEWLGPAWAGMPTEECLGTITTEEQLADAMGTLVKDHETAVNPERKATPWEWIKEKAGAVPAPNLDLVTKPNLDPGMQKELAGMLASRTDPIFNWLLHLKEQYTKHYHPATPNAERDLLRELVLLRAKQLTESRREWDDSHVVPDPDKASLDAMDPPAFAPPDQRQPPPENSVIAWKLRRELAFVECTACAAKPGMPSLCAQCLHNRDVIEQLHRRLAATLDNKP